jgi:Protein of unknown function (DUF3108)
MKEPTRPSAEDLDASLSMLVTAPLEPVAASLQGRPRRAVLWGLIVAALALHLFFLDSLGAGAQRDQVVAKAAALEVRSLPAPAAPVTPAAAVEAPPQARKPAPPPAEAPRAQAPAGVPVATARAAAPAAPSALKTPEVDSVAPLSAEAAAPAPPAPSTPPAHGDVPVYSTQLPPSLRLQYALRRGALSGSGELQWRLADGGYQLSLEGRLAGLAVLKQISQGRIDEAGLAPLRFTDQRRRGGVQAANFQRGTGATGEGKVTFSGPTNEYPLLPGTQDRLSWMLQLAAVAAAEPERLAPGGKVVLYVVGARGDADVWVFRFVDFELIDTAEGPLRTAKFSRDPRRLYDTQVEAWLDPARHHLPVKARLGTSPDGDALELQLQSLQAL